MVSPPVRRSCARPGVHNELEVDPAREAPGGTSSSRPGGSGDGSSRAGARGGQWGGEVIIGATANRALGEVEFEIEGRHYVCRFGNRELAALEEQWSVGGLAAIYTEGVQKSNARFLSFARMALSRHHGDLTEDDVADLLDFRLDDGSTRPAVEAVIAAFEAAVPKKRTTETHTAAVAPKTKRR